MSLIHEMLIRAKSDEKIRILVSLLQAICRSDAGGDVTTASSSGTGSPMTSRSTGGYASHAIRHKSRFGGYIKGLEVKIHACVEQGDEDETREGGLAVLLNDSRLIIVSGNIRVEESQRDGPFRPESHPS
jgi:hypothetical protein